VKEDGMALSEKKRVRLGAECMSELLSYKETKLRQEVVGPERQ